MGAFERAKNAASVALPWILSIVPPAALFGWVLWLWDEVVASAAAHPLAMVATCLLALCVGIVSGWHLRKLANEKGVRKAAKDIESLPDCLKGCLGMMWLYGKPTAEKRFELDFSALTSYGLVQKAPGTKERWIVSDDARKAISRSGRIRSSLEKAFDDLVEESDRKDKEKWKADFDRLSYEDKDALICVWEVPDGECMDGVEEARLISTGLASYMWVEEVSADLAVLHLEPKARRMMDEHREAILKLRRQ